MRMIFDAEFDREVDPELHYVCPGGYEATFKDHGPINFDFNEHIASIGEENKKVVHFECEGLECVADDKDTSEDFAAYLIEHISAITGFNEFFIFTGEDKEPEIRFVKLRTLLIEVPRSAKKIQRSEMFTIESAGDVLFCYATPKLLTNIVFADSRG